MSVSRLVSVVALLVTACAGWESAPSGSAPPPAEGVTPSHYAPPPPAVPNPGLDPSPPPEAEPVQFTAAIASVQLLEDCPDPVAAGAPSQMQAKEMAAGARARSSQEGDSLRRSCTQSTVQLSLRSDAAGPFRVEAIRVIDPNSQRAAGTTTLRGPTRWSDSDGMYTPWDGRVAAGAELKISYKLGELDLARASELVGPAFNQFGGPFILELEVSLAGQRRTIRSSEFTREPVHIMVT